MIGRGSEESVRNLLVLVGHSAAADSEQGNREFDKHDCMLVAGRYS